MCCVPAQVLEGYGSTETSAIACTQVMGDGSAGTLVARQPCDGVSTVNLLTAQQLILPCPKNTAQDSLDKEVHTSNLTQLYLEIQWTERSTDVVHNVLFCSAFGLLKDVYASGSFSFVSTLHSCVEKMVIFRETTKSGDLFCERDANELLCVRHDGKWVFFAGVGRVRTDRRGRRVFPTTPRRRVHWYATVCTACPSVLCCSSFGCEDLFCRTDIPSSLQLFSSMLCFVWKTTHLFVM